VILYDRLSVLGGIIDLRCIGYGVINYIYHCAVMDIIRILKASNGWKYVPIMRSQKIIDVPMEPAKMIILPPVEEVLEVKSSAKYDGKDLRSLARAIYAVYGVAARLFEGVVDLLHFSAIRASISF
jgi:hypothetical protein